MMSSVTVIKKKNKDISKIFNFNVSHITSHTSKKKKKCSTFIESSKQNKNKYIIQKYSSKPT